ncbi:MAG: hypothetical protein EAX89_00790 [Candidatus Lokiarchaeota archaeon]|nr:hypothetical protein [Candidatus Lokiarchaeota archaeon]
MTNVSGEIFLQKLYEVVYKLSGIAKTQSYRFKKEWDENLTSLNQTPHLVRQIPVLKDKFLNEIDYRINILDTVRLSFEDGFNSIRSLLNTLYNHYFKDSTEFKRDFNDHDQLILKYLVAKEILGNLIQYNQLDHETVPLKFNILARNYTMIKLKGQKDIDILENMKKVKIEIELAELKNILDDIVNDGFLNKTRRGRYFYYDLNLELALSADAMLVYNQTIRPLVEWPTLFWRSYYNIRELNVTVDKDIKESDYLNDILLKAATQGYVASHYVFKNLVNYYQKIKEAS